MRLFLLEKIKISSGDQIWLIYEQALKQWQLIITVPFLIRTPLLIDILAYHVFISMLSNRSDIIPLRPHLSPPLNSFFTLGHRLNISSAETHFIHHDFS